MKNGAIALCALMCANAHAIRGSSSYSGSHSGGGGGDSLIAIIIFAVVAIVWFANIKK